MAGAVGHDRLQRRRLAELPEHRVGDLLDAALDAGPDVVGLADPPALEDHVDRPAVVDERGSTRAGSRVEAYSGSGSSPSASVVKYGMTFSGNWYGP